MKIYKFGGTSVGKPERMQQVSQIIQNDNSPKIVVLSALSGVTNQLVNIAADLQKGQKTEALQKIKALHQHHQTFVDTLYTQKNIIEQANSVLQQHIQQIETIARKTEPFTEVQEKEILAQGELISTQLFHYLLQEQGKNSVLLPALDFMRINEDEEPDEAFIEQAIQKVLANFQDKTLFVTQGYICKNHQGQTDNLKRGGSDYTASLLGAALRAEEIQIWTDIDGMHNNDPRYVKNTQPVAEISFDEAAELAYFGAKILHPASIIPAQKYGIPVLLLNTMQPDAQGTRISNNPKRTEDYKITSIAAKDGITAIKIKSTRMLLAYGFLRKVFEIFEKYKTPIDMITTSEVAISLTIDNDHALEQITAELTPYGSIEVDKNQTIICVVGDFVTERKGTALRIFEALKDIPLRMISFGGSRHNVSVLVKESYKEKALNDLQQIVFEQVVQN